MNEVKIDILNNFCFLPLFSSIDQLAKVVRHHIEAANRLQNELVLVWNDSM